VAVDRADGEQDGERGLGGAGAAVGEDDELAALVGEALDLVGQVAEPLAEACLTSKRVEKVRMRVGPQRERRARRPASEMTGPAARYWRAWAGEASSQEWRRPMVTASDITEASRMESMGGLVTWANRCLK
jgi:hypothetical protein